MKKVITEFPKYEVHSDGQIYSTLTSKFLKQVQSKDGTAKVNLYAEGKRKSVYVHRLVAKAFISNPNNKPQVDHVDGNKQNNSVSNLRWCTNEENQDFREAQGNVGVEPQLRKRRVKWGAVVYPSMYRLAKKIAELRGSKVETVRKELKTIKYGGKTLYGKWCELV